MIGVRVASSGENSSTSSPERQDSPTVLLPVSAEDFARTQARRKWFIALAILAVALGSFAVYRRATAPGRAREAYDAGERLFSIARYTQAILSLDNAIGYMPEYAEAFLLRGRARLGMNDVEGAIPDFSRVIELRPDEADGYVARAAAYVEFKNYGAALEDCTAALSRDPRLSAAHNLMGVILRATGKSREALAQFTEAIELDENLDNLFQRGATYQQLGEHKLAIADFNRAIAFNPSSPEAYFSRADSKRALGDKGGAEADHRKGRLLDSH